jgi:phosphatidylglycerol:prolipoprotein diacylglycerol transferase
MLVSGLLGSRVFYVALNAGAFVRACTGAGSDAPAPRAFTTMLTDCTRVLQIWEGGLVFYGGFLAAAITVFFFARRQRWSFWTIGDVFAPSLAIGHVFGRLGCFAAGCCFGKACAAGARWCATFGQDSVAFEALRLVSAIAPDAARTPALFPTQLYEAAGELAIFILLCAVRRGQRVRAPGTLLLLYAALYGALRFLVELYRGDFARRFVVELDTPRLSHRLGLPPGEAVLLSTGQLVSLSIAIAAIAVLIQRRRRGVSSQA